MTAKAKGRKRARARFASLDAVKKANAAIGNHWFSEGTLRYFGSKVHPGLFDGRFFITSEERYEGTRAFTVREAYADGTIGEVGTFLAHATHKDALTALAHHLAAELEEARKRKG